jgi:ribonucleoside-diphosphate reductase alpha subunit
VEVWNGEEWSKTTVKQTGTNQNLVSIHFSNYASLNCTSYHKFYVEENDEVKEVKAMDLKVGDRLMKFKLPGDDKEISLSVRGKYLVKGFSDTFCFTEEKRGMGVFNGILTGQCSEIVEYTAPDETAVCSLASINLSKFVDIENSTMYYKKLAEIAGKVTSVLNKTIDYSFYPTECAKRSHFRHRPLGLGISGLQDVFFILKIPFNSEKAKVINRRIMESIYYGAVKKSIELAKLHGTYETYQGSPASQGKLNFDLWNTKPDEELGFDWNTLRHDLEKYGLKNSLHIALMPTASSASILGVTECFEPQKSNIFKRQVLSGEFVLVNKYLAKELEQLGLWNDKIVNKILWNQGSIQSIAEIPDQTKQIFKTAYEHSMKDIIDMAADRNPWVDQSQSLNLFVEVLDDINKLTSMLFYAYSKNLKTLMYYLKIKPRGSDVKFTVEKEQTCESCEA